jgi:hypothetical protein
MLLVSTSLALLVIYAGVKLLIQTKKETLGSLFRYAAWFFIIAGFFTLAATGAACLAVCAKYGMHMMHKNKMMGDERYMMGHHKKMMGHHKDHKKKMKYYHGESDRDCTVNINCGCGIMCKCDDNDSGCKCDGGAMCKPDSMKNK